jgi:tRNA threonylcarbamoyladenosine biosynthesis protein TsaE
MNFNREKRLRTRSEAGTLGLGQLISELLRPPKLVLLRGDLGAGKTTLVKGLASALGAADMETITSPTFTLLHEYKGHKVRIFHLDLYRIETERELEGIGIWEIADAGDALILVEWGERFPALVQRADAEISITPGETETERLLLIRWQES